MTVRTSSELVLRMSSSSSGSFSRSENDAVVRIFQVDWFSVFKDSSRYLYPLSVPKIEQYFPDFPLEAIRCGVVGSFSGSSCVSSRSVLFPD